MTQHRVRIFAACLLGSLAASAHARRKLPESMMLRLDDESLLGARSAACPCADASLCQPVTAEHRKEVFGFTAGKDWDKLDWKQVHQACLRGQCARQPGSHIAKLVARRA